MYYQILRKCEMDFWMHSINKNFHKRCTLSDSNGIIHFFWVTTFLMTLNITVVWNSSSISGKEKKKKKDIDDNFINYFSDDPFLIFQRILLACHQ